MPSSEVQATSKFDKVTEQFLKKRLKYKFGN